MAVPSRRPPKNPGPTKTRHLFKPYRSMATTKGKQPQQLQAVEMVCRKAKTLQLPSHEIVDNFRCPTEGTLLKSYAFEDRVAAMLGLQKQLIITPSPLNPLGIEPTMLEPCDPDAFNKHFGNQLVSISQGPINQQNPIELSDRASHFSGNLTSSFQQVTFPLGDEVTQSTKRPTDLENSSLFWLPVAVPGPAGLVNLDPTQEFSRYVQLFWETGQSARLAETIQYLDQTCKEKAYLEWRKRFGLFIDTRFLEPPEAYNQSNWDFVNEYVDASGYDPVAEFSSDNSNNNKIESVVGGVSTATGKQASGDSECVNKYIDPPGQGSGDNGSGEKKNLGSGIYSTMEERADGGIDHLWHLVNGLPPLRVTPEMVEISQRLSVGDLQSSSTPPELEQVAQKLAVLVGGSKGLLPRVTKAKIISNKPGQSETKPTAEVGVGPPETEYMCQFQVVKEAKGVHEEVEMVYLPVTETTSDCKNQAGSKSEPEASEASMQELEILQKDPLLENLITITGSVHDDDLCVCFLPLENLPSTDWCKVHERFRGGAQSLAELFEHSIDDIDLGLEPEQLEMAELKKHVSWHIDLEGSELYSSLALENFETFDWGLPMEGVELIDAKLDVEQSLFRLSY